MKRLSWLILLTPALPFAAVFLPGGKWLLPLLAPLVLFPAFMDRVRERDYRGAWTRGMVWAVLLSAGVILLVLYRPEWARSAIFHGEPYRREMFGWIATGEARETDPRAFVPQHLLHLGAFLLLTWLTAGYLGLVLGAALVAYMSYFVAAFAATTDHPFLASLAAWVPWSVVRVMAFVLLGCLFARPLLARRLWPFERLEYRLLLLGLSGIATDLLIKTFCAPGYGRFLRQLVRDGSLLLGS